MRPTSWGKDVVREWRNASDEVWGALMRACYKAGIFESWLALKEKEENETKKS